VVMKGKKYPKYIHGNIVYTLLPATAKSFMIQFMYFHFGLSIVGRISKSTKILPVCIQKSRESKARLKLV
jgi:hypothetical protein